jgi:hypothetical protein
MDAKYPRRKLTRKRFPCKKPRCQCSIYCKLSPIPNSQSPFCSRHQNCHNISPLSGFEPDYQPKEWNDPDDLRNSHNCFSYAFNVWDKKKRENCKNNGDCGFHQPGYAAGYPSFSDKQFKTCSDMMARLEGDNKIIKRTTFKKRSRPGFSKIAVIVDPNADFHFLRQDSNGYWSHKPGSTNVTNLDSDGNLIFNPELANYCYTDKKEPLHYWKFCKYYEVPRNRPVFVKGGRLTRKCKKAERQEGSKAVRQ